MTHGEDKCFRVLNRIDPYLDGELDAREVAAFEEHVAGCAACRDELALARAVLGELRDLPGLECPRRVVESAAERCEAGRTGSGRSTARRRLTRRIADWFRGPGVPAFRPAMAVMVLVIAAVSVFVVSRHGQSPFHQAREEALTEQEIELAKLDAMLAFAYLGKYSRRTAEIVKEEVIKQRVIEPLGDTIAQPIYPFPT
jgi:anti-sigma factor RsiW